MPECATLPVLLDQLLDKIGQVKAAPAPKPKLRDGLCEVGGLQFHIKHMSCDNGTVLTYRACLGYLPFTIEAKAQRRVMQEIMHAAAQVTGHGVSLDDHHALRLERTVHHHAPVSDLDILSDLVTIYFEAKPALDAIGEAMGSGTVQQGTA